MTSRSASLPLAGPARRRSRLAEPRVAVSVVFVLGLFMTILDTTIVNVALPEIADAFDASPSAVASVAVAYLVSLAVLIPASGWLGDRFGTKRVYVLALVVFTVASALCGLASTLPQLVAARLLQGVGGGMMIPVGMSMLMHTFPPAERIRAARVLTIPAAFAPAMGPVVGGLLVTQVAWQWVFYLNVPIGVGAIAFAAVYLRERREPTVGAFDLPGFLLAGVGLASVMFAVSEGTAHGWTSPLIVVTGTAGIALLAVLVLVERRTAEPLLDLDLYADRLFRTASSVVMVAIGGFLGAMYLLPLLLQDGHGLSALESGLTVFPTAIGVMIASQVASRLYPRVGPRRLMVGGLLAVVVALGVLALIAEQPNLWVVRATMLVLGLGMAHVFIPSQTAAFAGVPSSSNGAASTLFNVQRQLGSAVGVAVLGVVLAVLAPTGAGAAGDAVGTDLTAYRWGFVAAAAMVAIGVLLALRIRDADAASTMAPVAPEPVRVPAG